MAQGPACPNINLPEWKQLTEKLGETLLPLVQQVKSMKMYMENGEDEIKALAKLNPDLYTSAQKEERLRTLSNSVVFIGTADPTTGQKRHEYRDRAGNELVSVSRKLDTIPVLAYRGDDAGLLYADSGTTVHKVFEMVAAGGEKTLVNARKFAADNQLPASLVDYASAFIAELRQSGTVLVETNLRDSTLPIAGRADIIHLKHNGTVDLYDIKTAYRTPTKIAGNKKIWDPVGEHEGYKSQRYTAQLELYGQMVEKAIGHPVTGHYLLPIEIEFKDNVPTAPISTYNTLPKVETSTYGYQRRARQLVGEILGSPRHAPLPGLATIDDSSAFISRMTGVTQGFVANQDKEAEQILSRKNSRNQYWNGRHFVSLRSGDHAAQVQQIIDEHLDVKRQNFRDLEPSVKNYISTGEDAYLSTKGKEFATFRTILDDYKGRKDISVVSLSDIGGFEDKNNWILIRKGDVSDLLYLTNDELDRPFMVSRDSWWLSRATGSDRSLFGNLGFSWKDAKYDLSSKLRNNMGDAKKVEAVLIAMKLKTVEPLLKLDRVLIHSMSQFSPVPHAVNLTEVLPVVKRLMEHPKAESFVPTTYRSLVSNAALFDPASYQQDYAKSYHDLLGDALSYTDKQILDGVSSYYKDHQGLREVIGLIRDRLTDMYDSGGATPQNLEQRRLLGEMDFFLRNIDTSATVASTFEKWGAMPQNIASQVIQDVVGSLRNAIARIRTGFWENYKKDFNKATENLFRSSRTLHSALSDYTISNTTKYYALLLEMTDYKVLKTVNGKPVSTTMRLPTFNMVIEGSREFENLDDAQKAYITKFNDTIQKGADIMGVSWLRGRVPLLKASFYNQFYRYTKGEEAAYQGLLTKAFNSLEEGLNLGLEQDTGKSHVLRNRFASQDNSELYDNGRQKLLGVSADGVAQPEIFAEFETNLEVIADAFMMEAIRVKEFESVNGHFNSAKSVFEWQKSKLFEEQMGINLDWAEIVREANVHMRDMDSGTVQSKTVNSLNKVASLALIAGRPSVGIFNYMQQQLSAALQSTANSLGVSKNYGLSEWSKAFFEIASPSNFEKVNLLLVDTFGMYDMSMTDLTNGRRREGNKSIFRLKYLYAMLSAGDWMSRGQVMVAQMIKDGTWNAYSVVDGKLVYNETLDGRLNGDKMELAKGRALKEFTIKELAEQGIHSPAGHLLRAYGPSESAYMKNLADSLFGGYDRDSRANFNFVAMGKFMGLFKNWLPARLDAMFDRPFVSRMNGALNFEKKPDGEYSAVWTGRQQEGILHTMLYLGWYLGKYRSNPYQKLTPHQQNNLRLATLQLATISMFTLLATAVLGGDDDKDPWRQKAATTLHKSLGDLIATYNILALTDFVHTPIAIVFIERTWQQTMNLLAGKKDINDKTIGRMLDKTPIVNGFREVARFVDAEPDNSPVNR